MSDYDTGSLQRDPTTDAQTLTIAEPGDRITVAVAGGTLVYEARELGRELIGFRDVADWDDLADALAARGHARGAIYHLPELDDGAERGA